MGKMYFLSQKISKKTLKLVLLYKFDKIKL